MYTDTEVEPFVAVDPTDPSNVIGVYQQDRWSDGAARGLVASRSADGGRTWTESYAAFSECSGGDPVYDRATDPWVTFDAAGDAYQISLSISADQATSAILVSKSTDQGATWGPPVTLVRDDTLDRFNDKESITGDPTRPGHVYAVWDRVTSPLGLPGRPFDLPSVLRHGVPLFSRTTDGGQTWSTPTAMTGGLLGTVGNQIAVLPNGTLVDVFFGYRRAGLLPTPNSLFIGVVVSTDAGESWSRPIPISDYVPAVSCDGEQVCDPDSADPVRAGTNLPDIAVDPATGRVYVVWADARFSGGGTTDVVLSSSDDGTNWSTPVKVNQTPTPVAAFNATVDVSSDGTVGVLYYDFRENTPAPPLPTTVLLAHSHDAGATWTEQRLAEPFDMQNAPVARGLFLGDYQGLDNIGRDFLAFFSRTGAADDTADVVSVRVSAP
ncbi:sialidase family protein [Geodermatophilus marinus]|uniref:sialidase family protein n=1 Tax=Geodermatophilus sp. LHW52908 TaxID=2303986 RepID=UPI0011C0F86C|nr:sialidase family protein [Geodermatophilus sp. LHW52908]